MKIFGENFDSRILNIKSNGKIKVARQFSTGTKFGSEKGKVQKPARIPPQTPPPRGKSAEAKRKIKIPRKKDFRFAESVLKPHALPEYLEGRTPKEKHPFLSFFKEKFTPAKPKMQGVFFLSGLLAYSPVRGAFSERTIFVRATTRSARASFEVLLEMSPNFLV